MHKADDSGRGATQSLKLTTSRVNHREKTGKWQPTGSFLRFEAEAQIDHFAQAQRAAGRREMMKLIARAQTFCSPQNPYRRTFEKSLAMEFALWRATQWRNRSA
jgi:hypothetical protein